MSDNQQPLKCGVMECDNTATHIILHPNRYQLPVCVPCRDRILAGDYLQATAISLEDLADRYLYAAENELAEIVGRLQEGDEWTAAVQQCGTLTGLPWHQYVALRREHFAERRARSQ